MPPEHPPLTEPDVLAGGGWHPRYVRVLAVTSDGDYGFSLTDGNGDGAELEDEKWQWADGAWEPRASSGAGPLDRLGPIQTGGFTDDAYYAYGRVPGRRSVTIEFDGQEHEVPVNRHEVWAFIKVRTDPGGRGVPTLRRPRR